MYRHIYISCIGMYIYIYNHHHVVPLAQISLTLSLATSSYRSSPLAGLQGSLIFT